jgi:hypothetical protein
MAAPVYCPVPRGRRRTAGIREFFLADRWLLIDEMVSDLGAVYALEVEAAAFPELASDPALNDVHLAVLRATDAMIRVATIRGADGDRLERAREALDAALSAASSARSLLAQARASRNRSD